MPRTMLWVLLILIVAVNLGFDLVVTPAGVRVARKLEVAEAQGNPTDAPFFHPVRPPLRGFDRYVPLWIVARGFLTLRYFLTGLPLLLVLILALLHRLRESHLALAVWVGAFVLIGKAVVWESLWLMADVCVYAPP